MMAKSGLGAVALSPKRQRQNRVLENGAELRKRRKTLNTAIQAAAG
jgi:hypothetical protein